MFDWGHIAICIFLARGMLRCSRQLFWKVHQTQHKFAPYLQIFRWWNLATTEVQMCFTHGFNLKFFYVRTTVRSEPQSVSQILPKKISCAVSLDLSWSVRVIGLNICHNQRIDMKNRLVSDQESCSIAVTSAFPFFRSQCKKIVILFDFDCMIFKLRSLGIYQDGHAKYLLKWAYWYEV